MAKITALNGEAHKAFGLFSSAPPVQSCVFAHFPARLWFCSDETVFLISETSIRFVLSAFHHMGRRIWTVVPPPIRSLPEFPPLFIPTAVRAPHADSLSLFADFEVLPPSKIFASLASLRNFPGPLHSSFSTAVLWRREDFIPLRSIA